MGALSDLLFGIRTVFFGADMPLRGTIEFAGSAVNVADDVPNKRTVVTVSPTGLGNVGGVATVDATTIALTGDGHASDRTTIGSALTPDDTPLATTVYTSAGDDVVALEVLVVARDQLATQRGRWRIGGIAAREAGTLAFESGADVDAAPKASDPGLDAVLVIAGNDVKVQVTGLAGTDLRWSWRVRVFRVVF